MIIDGVYYEKLVSFPISSIYDAEVRSDLYVKLQKENYANIEFTDKSVVVMRQRETGRLFLFFEGIRKPIRCSLDDLCVPTGDEIIVVPSESVQTPKDVIYILGDDKSTPYKVESIVFPDPVEGAVIRHELHIDDDAIGICKLMTTRESKPYTFIAVRKGLNIYSTIEEAIESAKMYQHWKCVGDVEPYEFYRMYYDLYRPNDEVRNVFRQRYKFKYIDKMEGGFPI